MTYFQKQFESKEFKKLSKFTKTDTLEIIIKLFNIHKQMSVLKISEFLDLDKFTVLNYLTELEIKREIIKIEDKNEISCNMCSSVSIKYLFQCPECYAEDFDKVKLIEHYNCENISLEIDYTNNICPNCNEEIKILGIDYKIINNMFVCSLCLERFLEPIMNLTCMKCQSLFKLKDAKWNNTSGFSLLKKV